MKKFILVLCLLGSVCFGDIYTVTRHQINLRDYGIEVVIGDDIFIADYVEYAGQKLYYVEINPFEINE